jgi:hypothetical protein
VAPSVLAFAADACEFAALSGQDVGVAGVGVTPAQVSVQVTAQSLGMTPRQTTGMVLASAPMEPGGGAPIPTVQLGMSYRNRGPVHRGRLPCVVVLYS